MPASARGKASLSCTAFNDMCEMIWFRHNSNIKVDLNSFVLPTGRKLQDTKVLNFGKILGDCYHPPKMYSFQAQTYRPIAFMLVV